MQKGKENVDELATSGELATSTPLVYKGINSLEADTWVSTRNPSVTNTPNESREAQSKSVDRS